ncbi:MAG: hypothetical protein KBS86_03235 [Proteobacteria bacterium]|nr:hypothetical protein [Candidatus Enterousia scatequi]
MKSKSSVIAQKLVNLYRQEHVIQGGWAALNPIFVAEATPDVIREMRNIPTSKFLIKHIENLRNGTTPMDSIETDLLPYSGLMSDEMQGVSLSDEDWSELESALNAFTPTQEGLNLIESLSVVNRLGDEWYNAIKSALSIKPELFAKWELVGQTQRAYYLWNIASDIIQRPITERIRAQVQADMPEYETYLPMFGDAGADLLNKLRNSLSSFNHDDESSSSVL